MAVDVEKLYRTHGAMVYRRCLHLLKDEAAAQDALHDVFVKLLRHEQTLEGTSPSSLLYRIATNTCLNRIRSRSRRPEDPNEALLLRIASAEELEDQSMARSLLSWLFGSEPVSSRSLAVMHLLDGMTLEEVAEIHQLSVSGVRKRLRRLRARLDAQEGVTS